MSTSPADYQLVRTSVHLVFHCLMFITVEMACIIRSIAPFLISVTLQSTHYDPLYIWSLWPNPVGDLNVEVPYCIIT